MTTQVDKAQQIVAAIDAGYRGYREAFVRLTEQAAVHFASADWLAAQRTAKQRLELYDQATASTVATVRELLNQRPPSPGFWTKVKRAFSPLLASQHDYELIETFFNSIHRKVTHNAYVLQAEMYLQSEHQGRAENLPLWKLEVNNGELEQSWQRFLHMTLQTLRVAETVIEFEDLARDARHLAQATAAVLPGKGWLLEFAPTPFFRNKAAYWVGCARRDEALIPITLPILNRPQRLLYVDACLIGEEDMSIVFSFTRSYFAVRAPSPSSLVQFLSALMPQKKASELYSSIGYPKHGKTEFIRNFMAHLRQSDDQFIVAPGIKGMVMCVFTLPSHQTVFKIIKDHFAPQKNTTHAHVKAAYELVKNHDRVGRMADTQEFTNITLPRQRFSEELIQELTSQASSSVLVARDWVTISHLYTERRMTPLNLFLMEANATETRAALYDYGLAIRQLAAANIFPGDMLLKNFGVTRHGRVVFYDYDEISYLTDVNFRKIPQARNDADEMSSEPWYSVAPGDVFPEEFERFLFGRAPMRLVFREMHADLYDPSYWLGLQSAIRQGDVLDVFPYPQSRRFEAA